MSNVYMNRELSWLKFNERVLEEAENPEVPLCERMTFVSIYQSNLDEFFRVRVGSLQDQMLISTEIRENKTKMTSAEQIRAIIKEVKKLNQRKDKAYEKLMKKIEEYGITLINHASAKSEEKKFLEKYFMKEIMPLSSPTIVGKRQPFPFLKNGEIYAVVVLETRNKKERIGIIPCSNNMLTRMVELPGGKGRYMLIEDLILHYIGKVFKGYKVKGKSLLKVVRNADIDADAAYDEDLDYREFAKIYEYMHHLGNRYKYHCYLVMVTMETNPDHIMYIENIEDALDCMEQAIRQKIRKVDICTHYSSMQYLIILFEAEESEIKDIMERIFTQYRKEYKGTSLLPKYEYISMMKEEKKETQV